MSSYSDLKNETKGDIDQQYLASQAQTLMDARCLLDIDSKPQEFRATKIICTIGPASRSVEKLTEMINAGMDVARLNFSHGDHDYHRQTIANIKTAAAKFEESTHNHRTIALALDTKGPEIRTGLLDSALNTSEIQLRRGQQIRVTTDDAWKEKCSETHLWLDYKNLPLIIKPNDKIFIDDGLICLKVMSIGQDWMDCEIENAGSLGSRKGVNLPGLEVDLPAVSEKDQKDIQFGIEQGVDFIYASFIRKAEDIRSIRCVLGEKGAYIKIFSKIENHEGVRKIDEILNETDGIMVARGDMGIEIPAEKVFLAQKMIISRCNAVGKPVICATQMLESMVKAPRPTRAEVSDVANAVLDGCDSVMLSGETAKGDYPVEAVRMQHLIAREAEPAIYHRQVFNDLRTITGFATDATETVAIAVVEAAMKCQAAGIICLTTSGRSAHLISKYRPQCPIFSITRKAVSARQSTAYKGIVPIYYKEDRIEPWSDDIEARVNLCMEVGKSRKLLETGKFVVIVTGWRKGSGATNTMRIAQVQ